MLICDGADGMDIKIHEGNVKACDNIIISMEAKETEEKIKSETHEPEKKKRVGVNFDFLQKLGKVLMVVIAVMPAAGLMISIGKLCCCNWRGVGT